MNSKTRQITARELIDQLASSGRYCFTSLEARNVLQVSPEAAKLALNRLRKQGLIATPVKGFYIIIPPEYRALGCLPADQFIPELMREKNRLYYAALLSAAQYHGAAHQRPQQFQVMLEKNLRPIQCGRTRVMFVARKRIKEVATASFNTPRGEIKVSTPEATALDLAGYPQHAGGLDHVATVLAELSDLISPTRLFDAAATAPLPWVQRLGYLLHCIDARDLSSTLQHYITERVREYTPLMPGAPIENANRAPEWKILANVTVKPEL